MIIIFLRSSRYDSFRRENFVEITSHLDNMNLTEKDEFDIFNENFEITNEAMLHKLNLLSESHR